MKYRAFILIAYLLSLTAQAQTPDELAVTQLSRQKFNWLIHKKYDSLNILMEDQMQWIHSNGWIQTKEDVINDIKNGKVEYLRFTEKFIKARLYGSTAIVTGLTKAEGINTGKPFNIDLMYTEIYIKSGNQWKLVSRHANKMPD